MSIYTRTGDQGKTSLFSGERLYKDNIRVRAYGEVDELNAVVGLLAAVLPAGCDETARQLARIQSDLFHVGGWLAAVPGSEARQRLTAITPEFSGRIETWIDAMQNHLPELKVFILPGGHPGAAQAHVARTVGRRAERAVIALVRQEETAQADPSLSAVVMFLNRLSDYFFVLARYLNKKAGVPDTSWNS
ncbi:MAG: cob(I)yrinic acid a,c-diamide adenosyltransferase [Desulfobacteraceae bacterium]|nr:cob(I)yrinic acid a,c-diamide adenosyltransferase [Desulfobacteraceae bacterium]